MKRITVITDFDNHYLKSRLFIFLKNIYSRFRLRRLPKNNLKYGGHYAVTRSLLDGFKSINQKVKYNPKFDHEFTECCIVLSSYEALLKAIDLKRKGVIKVLLAGPNLVVLPSDFKGIISDPNIDYCLVPSLWVSNKYIKVEPKLLSRVKIWPAGVNISDWPIHKINSNSLNKVLFYIKSHSLITEAEKCELILKSKSIKVVKIIYGDYKYNEYNKILSDVDLSIFFSSSESQGIALLESWASNVPTWVCEVGFWKSPHGDIYGSSAAPYLSDTTGNSFSSEEEFIHLLSDWEHLSKNYSPREWVKKNMTDKISARNLLKIIKTLNL